VLSFLIAGPPAGMQGYSFATFDTHYPPAAGLCESHGHVRGGGVWDRLRV